MPFPAVARLRTRSLRTAVTAAAAAALLAGCAEAWATSTEGQPPAIVGSVHSLAADPTVYPGARVLLSGVLAPTVAPKLSPYDVVKEVPETTADQAISSFTERGIKIGVYGDPGAQHTIALVGGSHAEMWISALDVLGKRDGFRVTTYLKMGCPLSSEPNPTTIEGAAYPDCHDWSIRVIDRLKQERPDAVFTTVTRPDFVTGGDTVPPTYLDVFNQLSAAGIDILGMRDTPWPRNAAGFINTPPCLVEGGTADSCGSPRALALSAVNPAIGVAATHPHLHLLDVSNALCNDKTCPAILGNMIVYKDQHHLSAIFVRSLADELGRQLSGALAWIR